MIKRLFKYLLKAIWYFLLLIVALVSVQYMLTPIYDFPEPEPFQGDYLYNPYEGMDSSNWHKGNFQVQSLAWGGITDGRKNTSEYVFEVYEKLGYDVIGISDYMKINKYGSDRQTYIPLYEHGYGIRKNHQIVMGAKRVIWRDYPIFQNLHHKQHVLNYMQKHSDLIFIAHPRLRHGYSADDMRYLSNYDGIEVLNGYRVSLQHWDAALSSGYFRTIIANDDAHDISNPDEVGHYATFINAPTGNSEDLLGAFKAGRTFGADIERDLGEPLEDKVQRAKTIPILNDVKLRSDTLKVSVSSIATEIRFIGQDGEQKKLVQNSAKAYYVFTENDTYIRTEIKFPDRFTFYLNPVIRYNGTDPYKESSAEINILLTTLQRLGFLVLLIIIYAFFRKKRAPSK